MKKLSFFLMAMLFSVMSFAAEVTSFMSLVTLKYWTKLWRPGNSWMKG